MPGDVEARTFPKGVFVITSQWGDRRAGMTAAWVTRVSAVPAMMAVALHRGSATREIIGQSGWFVIHALPESELELARSFGRGSSSGRDKFAGLDVAASSHGQPVLARAKSFLECRVVRKEDVGDHQLIVGEVVSGEELRAGEPLRYREDEFSL
jgi:3-hydroxy-9,10-secoandrosta-1,3,5(10)-triene-9,17-dione monooxygenase reductase component